MNIVGTTRDFLVPLQSKQVADCWEEELNEGATDSACKVENIAQVAYRYCTDQDDTVKRERDDDLLPARQLLVREL